MADAANLGLSSVINEQKLGNEGKFDSLSDPSCLLTRSSVLDGPLSRPVSHDQPVSCTDAPAIDWDWP